MPAGGSNPLSAEAKTMVCRMFAEHAAPKEIQEALERDFGQRLARRSITYYREHPKWAAVIDKAREALEADVRRLPISSKYWRIKKRGDLIAKHETFPSALGAVRGLLLDAAKELGDVTEDGAAQLRGATISVEVVNQVLQLDPAALLRYVETGDLDPESYLPDVRAARRIAGTSAGNTNGQADVIDVVAVDDDDGPAQLGKG